MNKFLAIVLFIFACAESKQEHLPVTFIDYRQFEKSFENNPDSQMIKEDYNLLHILLLDSTMAGTFFKFDPKLKEDYMYALQSILLSKSTVGFMTDSESLKEVLRSGTLRNRIFECINPQYPGQSDEFKIFDPIYIKDSCAVVTISDKTETSFSAYYITLHHQAVQIHFLESIIEN